MSVRPPWPASLWKHFRWKPSVYGHIQQTFCATLTNSVPYHVIVANASGTGNRGVWEFYQEEGSAAIGQFDLKIFFRITNKNLPDWPENDWPENATIRDLYCVDWNLEVNQKKLVDHKIDLAGNWNMKVNGRPLMDKQEEKSDNKKMPDKDGFYQYWNVPLPYDPTDFKIELDESKLYEGQKNKRQKRKDEIFSIMIEEEPKAERNRLLRPLYLVNKPKEK
jgi:hypothetical protein